MQANVLRRYLITTLLIVVGISRVSAQQEFFDKSYGVTLSGGSNFNYSAIAGVDLHLQNHLILSGSFAYYRGIRALGAGVNYLYSGENEDSSTKWVFGFSYAKAKSFYTAFGCNMGIIQMIGKHTNFPASLSANATFSSIIPVNTTPNYYSYSSKSELQTISVTPVIGYTQALFANKFIYPVFGLTYHIPIDLIKESKEENQFFVFLGVNIKLN